MHDWLRDELRTIKDRKFHIIRAPQGAYGSEFRIDWPMRPPESYRKFIEEFGPAMLYRKLSFWLIRVHNRPVPHVDPRPGQCLIFGGFDSGRAYFRLSDLGASEAPVYETRGASGLFITAPSFDEWLAQRAHAARKRYKKAEWTKILRGPDPFTAEELEIVAARKQFQWRLLEVSKMGRMTFRVANMSDRRLPFLSLGIRGPSLVGGLWLPVADIGVGETRTVEKEGYTCMKDPSLQEAFDLPDPWPEDRERYLEFKSATG
ncbi:MAG: hypothetical protein NT154_04020 [Verrucomicrobia bacterium]|nr:hypothetical protein [Verrucomicrobiota bacterium]